MGVGKVDYPSWIQNAEQIFPVVARVSQRLLATDQMAAKLARSLAGSA
jgi:hypothetical protein